jgi:hypothetical protein
MTHRSPQPKNLDFKTLVVGVGFIFGALLGLAVNSFLHLDHNSAFYMVMISSVIGVCIGFAVGETV